MSLKNMNISSRKSHMQRDAMQMRDRSPSNRPESPRQQPTPLTFDRLGAGRKKKPPRPTAPLTMQACGDAWEEVCACLKSIEGLEWRADNDSVLAGSKVREADIDAVTKAIAILVDAGRPTAACTLLRMCKPSTLLALLEPCRCSQIRALKTSNDPNVRKAMDRPLFAAAKCALNRPNDPRFFKLFPFCSLEAKSSLNQLCPSLTREMVQGMDADTLIEAVRMILARIMTLEPDACLKELGELLQIANQLRAHELTQAVAMKCIVWPCLGRIMIPVDQEHVRMKLEAMAWFPQLTSKLLDHVPDSLKSEVLRVAVEQAVQSPDIEECTDRLRGLASLSGKIDEALAEELRSHVMTALSHLSLQGDEAVQGHWKLLKSVEKEVRSAQQSGIADLVRTKVRGLLGKASVDTLLRLAENFRLAIATGALDAAARLIHDCPYPEFGEPAREELFQAVVERFATVGLHLEQRPLRLGKAELNDKLKVQDDAQQDRVVLDMAIVLMATATGDLYYSTLATSILSMHFVTPEHQLAGIQTLIVRAGLELRDVIVLDVESDLFRALPELCSADHAITLEAILAMDEGRRLIAEAVVDYLLQDNFNGAAIGPLFKALAHRIDLRAALRLPEDPMNKILRQMKYAKLQFGFDEDFDWAPGWRLLACMHERHAELIEMPSKTHALLRAVQAIDAAAADRLHGGAREQLNALDDSLIQEALVIMLKTGAIHERLLTDDALTNVMRAFVSHGTLATRSFNWTMSKSKQVRLHAAAARALLSLLNDDSPCRFNKERPANHAVTSVARELMSSLTHRLLTHDVRYEIGKEALEAIDRARFH
ncbi:hypothetical protein [Variovorax soli]|uniref:Uncharacterized protein n=1 Tax=Variovorax soli TaxID=376815 RepID=A0ABU1N9L5_9BURK|nr:hypothetical protein [Variovorax soli]MDR6534997.1 hypothetical protein [Variovorax soli]